MNVTQFCGKYSVFSIRDQFQLCTKQERNYIIMTRLSLLQMWHYNSMRDEENKEKVKVIN